MEGIKAELIARAKFKVYDAAYWRGTVYRVEARYYRRGDGRDRVRPEGDSAAQESFRFQKKVREKDMEQWTMEKDLG